MKVMNGSGVAVREATVQVQFGEHDADDLTLSTVQLPGGSLVVTTPGEVVITAGQPPAVSWQNDLDASYAAAAADPGWVADRQQFGPLIEDAYEVDEDGGAG